MMRFLKIQRGSVAIEALASLFLLFVAVYVMWGVSILIYNQSKLTSATQLSSQAGILLANRAPASDPDIKNGITSVFAENICGMLPGQQSGSNPPGQETCQDGVPGTGSGRATITSEIKCSDALEGSTYSENNCSDSQFNRAIEVSVTASVRSPFSLIGAAGGQTNHNPLIEEESSVYSYAFQK